MARLATNQSFAARNNSNPEATLLRAGFVRCGHCGWAMRVNSASTSNGARYCCHTYRKGRCANPVITAAALDMAVWTHVAVVLRDPAIIAAEVERQRDDGALERDLAAVEKMLAAIAEKQAITARAITAVDDDEAAAPLIAELKALGERKKAAQRDRDNLARRIADAEADRARVRSVADWCATVATNVDRLTYDEKRLALQALGAQVRVWREGAVRDDGTPQPRWELTLRPVASDSSIMYPATSSTSGS
jgi:site-specific DNA recombinase